MITKFNFKDKTIKSYAIRKLTPFECFRLMGIRDDIIRIMQSTNAEAAERVAGYKSKGKAEDMAVSASQQYKQAGNSIVVDVLQLSISNSGTRKSQSVMRRLLSLPICFQKTNCLSIR